MRVRECVWLIRNGFQLDTAFQLDDLMRTAFCIIISEQEGAKFDWHTMDFEKEAAE